METTETTKTTKKTTTPAAPAAPKNIYAKLLDARLKFLDKGIKKSGVNMSLEYNYFELADIVPVALPIFKEVGLLPLFNCDRETAILMIVDIDDPASEITFSMPYNQLEGNRGTNSMQALGASQTYLRRYLYMAALDIIENDQIDNKAGEKEPEPKPIAPPASPKRREAVAKELTNPEAPADQLQIKQLKKLLKELKEKDPGKKDFIAQVAVETKSFTELSKSVCAEFITQVGDMLKEVADA